MISYLQGIVKYKEDDVVVLDVHGVGYEIFIAPSAMGAIIGGDELELFIYFHATDKSHQLFGFLTKQDMQFFKLLLNASGVGPKSALSIISKADPSLLYQAISAKDDSLLIASGIGKKTAERIVMELGGKLQKLDVGEMEESALHAYDGEVLEALKGLGYSFNDSRDALKRVSKDIEGAGERIKQALKILSR